MKRDRLMRLIGSLGLACSLAVAGCSGDSADRPETVPVSGTLTLAGSPVAGATITMSPENGASRPAIASTKDDGSFVMQTYVPGDGVIPGSYKITVVKYAKSDKRYDAPGDESDDYVGNTEPPEESVVDEGMIVPVRYADASQTDLRAVVEAGQPIDDLNLDMSP